jgi:hypothetical protein
MKGEFAGSNDFEVLASLQLGKPPPFLAGLH